jgi:hypothetical protein
MDKTLLERLQDIKSLAGDMLEGKRDKSFAEIYITLSDLILELTLKNIKEGDNLCSKLN